jgi:hypothetical protein
LACPRTAGAPSARLPAAAPAVRMNLRLVMRIGFLLPQIALFYGEFTRMVG